MMAAIFAALVVFCALPVAAETLRHHYRFDAARLVVQSGVAGASVAIRPAGPGIESLPGTLPATWDAGEPELPYEVVTFVVPRGSRVLEVRAEAGATITVAEGLEFAAAAAVLSETGVALAPKAAVTAAPSSLYPAVAAQAAGGGALHGYQLASVRVYPVRWDAAQKRLQVTTDLDIEVTIAPGGALPLQRERYRPEIENLARHTLEHLVVNPAALDTYDRRIGVRVEKQSAGFRPTDAPSLEGSDVDYVIITSNALAPAWQVLADWKTHRGVPTVIRTTEWIQAHYRHGSDLAETVRNFIEDAYAKWGVRYVLLAGDSDIIPARYGFSGFGEPSEQKIPTDMYFACLDGNWNFDGDALFGEAVVDFGDPGDDTDLYAEVFVGRVPLSLTTDVNTFVAKVMLYENPVLTDYQHKNLFLGEVLFPVDWTGGPITLDGGAFAEDVLSDGEACIDTTRLYENYTAFPGALPLTKSAAIAAMNAGPGFVNHLGHGFRYNMSCGDASFVNDDAFALTNGNRRFILYMVNCTAAAFDFPCLAEAFLKAQGGAVAVFGATRSAFAIPSRNYNQEFFRAVHQNGFAHLGEAFVQSRLAYTPNALFDTSDHYTHFLYNYLGDPEMVMHTCAVATTTVAAPDTIPTGPTPVTVHVETGGVPRAGALVCLSKGVNGVEAYESGLTNAAGDAVISFRAESAGLVQVAVSGQSMTTIERTIAVTAGSAASVHVRSVTLDDTTTPPANGNSDGTLDAGETLAVDVTAVNDGPQAAGAVTGVLRISGATVSDSTFSLGDIAGAGGTATANQELAFTTSPSTPDGTILPLVFTLTDSLGNTWTDNVNRVVHAPSMQLTLLHVDDFAPGGNGNGVIQAGETFDLLAYFKNYGTGTADGLTAELSTADPDLVLLTSSVAVGSAAPSQQVTGATHFRLTENVIDENPLTLTLTDSHGRVATWPITLRGPAKPAKPVLSTKDFANTVTMTWTPSTTPDLTGYHVYRGPGAFGPWTRITLDRTNKTAYYQDAGLAPSTKYYFYVTAVDSAGNESVPSDFASINTNPAQLSGWPILLSGSSTCPPAVGDVTGDGSKEIVVGATHLYTWNWDGIELRDADNDPQTWGVFSPAVKTVTSAISMADLDGNPGAEIFCASWDDSTKTFALGGDGELLPGWPQNPEPGAGTKGYWGSTAAVDLDGDGIAELFAPSRNGSLFAWRANGTPLGATAAFKTGFGINVRTSPAFANLDADPEVEIVFAAPNGVLNVWNMNGSNVPGYPVTMGGACLSNPAIGDVNHDGILDIVQETEGGGGFVHVYNSATATELPGWPRTLTIKGNPISPSPALADFDGDGLLEIVVANNGGSAPGLSRIQVFDSVGNTVLGWPRTVGSNNSESSPIVADISGDGVPDVLFGNESGFIYGWDWHGIDLPGFPITIGDFVRSTPYVDDVDGDGHVNLVLAGWDKNVYVWDFPATWYPSAAQWPTLKHDVQRSGQYGFKVDVTPPAPPTTLTSPSHTVSTWSFDNTVTVAWTGASDASGIGGYSFVWDTSPTTLPDRSIDTTDSTATSPVLTDGAAHWFHLRTADALGHWTTGALHLGPFWIDTSPPSPPTSVVADRAVSAWSNDNTVGATWSGAFDVGGIGGYSILWDDNAVALPDTVLDTSLPESISPPLADGTARWLHVRTVDNLGHWTADAVHLGPFWIDTVPPGNPVNAIADRAPQTWSNDNSLDVQWPAAIDPGSTPNAVPHGFSSRVADRPRYVAPHGVAIDVTTTDVTTAAGRLRQPFMASSSGVSGYSLVWDTDSTTVPDEQIETSLSNTTSPGLADGQQHWFHLRTIDQAGNAAIDTATLHLGPFWVDVTAPNAPNSFSPTPPAGAWVSAESVQVYWGGATDALSGVAGYSLLFDASAATVPDLIADPASTGALLAPAPEGSTWFHIRTLDVAGNCSGAAHEGPFRIDRTPPAVTVLAPNGGEVWANGSVQTIRWQATDAHSGVQSLQIRLSLDGGATYPDLIASPAPADSEYAWTIPAQLGNTMRVQVVATDAVAQTSADESDANFEFTTATDVAALPRVTRTALEAALPNPFNPATTIRYSLLETSRVRLALYDARGRLVRTLVDAVQAGPRWHTAVWNGRSDAGAAQPGGVYFVRMQTPGVTAARRIVLLK